MNPAARIRPFEDADVVPLRRLICETIDTSYAPVYPPKALDFFKAFHAEEKVRERARHGTVLVAEADGDLIATGSLLDGEIFAVFVHPDRQGAGLGKALMARLEEDACAAGVTESVLSVSLPSKRFYEGLGYEIVEERSRDLGNGQRLDFWKAKKRLVATASKPMHG